MRAGALTVSRRALLIRSMSKPENGTFLRRLPSCVRPRRRDTASPQPPMRDATVAWAEEVRLALRRPLRSDRRFGVVLNVPTDFPGTLHRVEPGYQMQGHVDARRNAGRRHHLSGVDKTVIGPHLDVGAE